MRDGSKECGTRSDGWGRGTRDGGGEQGMGEGNKGWGMGTRDEVETRE